MSDGDQQELGLDQAIERIVAQKVEGA